MGLIIDVSARLVHIFPKIAPLITGQHAVCHILVLFAIYHPLFSEQPFRLVAGQLTGTYAALDLPALLRLHAVYRIISIASIAPIPITIPAAVAPVTIPAAVAPV